MEEKMFYKLIRFLAKLLFNIAFDIKIHNPEKFDSSSGRCIICSNHISNLDPITVAISTKRQIHFMAKKELFPNKLFSFVLTKLGAFPVDREGISITSIKTAISVLNDDNILGIFPEGTRVDGYNESNAKPGVAMIANKANSNIIPIHIVGSYKFRGKINIYYGEEKNYFKNYSGKIRTEQYTEIGKEILKDIYSLN
jgi:1-acyl-sn-glycerol-3-phosphate acyltransferase